MLMLMMGKIFPILYIQTSDRPPQRLLLVVLVLRLVALVVALLVVLLVAILVLIVLLVL